MNRKSSGISSYWNKSTRLILRQIEGPLDSTFHVIDVRLNQRSSSSNHYSWILEWNQWKGGLAIGRSKTCPSRPSGAPFSDSLYKTIFTVDSHDIGFSQLISSFSVKIRCRKFLPGPKIAFRIVLRSISNRISNRPTHCSTQSTSSHWHSIFFCAASHIQSFC